MRKEFVESFLSVAEKDERAVFLSGDLGFMALEPLQEKLGARFINAGVAEQNMVSVAAGLAAKGFHPWVYSITPFITLRPYEQIRNDVCLHNLPVRIVGNGGGFGYGIMGSTHHALEDIGCLRMLPGMQVFVPTYSSDVGDLVRAAHATEGPVYLRLGKSLPGDCPDRSANWRVLTHGTRATVVSTGPIVGNLLEMNAEFSGGFDVFSVARFPFGDLPQALIESLKRTKRLITFEEHVSVGGLGESLAQKLLELGEGPLRFLPLYATGYSGKYGSQQWHLAENKLSGAGLLERLGIFLKGENG